MDFSDLLNGFSATKQTTLKDRMKTVILRAKQLPRDEFIKQLAADYIRISKEL